MCHLTKLLLNGQGWKYKNGPLNHTFGTAEHTLQPTKGQSHIMHKYHKDHINMNNGNQNQKKEVLIYVDFFLVHAGR